MGLPAEGKGLMDDPGRNQNEISLLHGVDVLIHEISDFPILQIIQLIAVVEMGALKNIPAISLAPLNKEGL